MPYLPLIILGLEQLHYKRKPALYTIILALLMMRDPYHAFLLCEFLGLYFFIHNFSSFKELINKGLYFLKASFYSAGLSAIYLVPFALVTKDSTYLEQHNTSPSIFKFYKSIFSIMASYKTFDYSGAISSDSSKASIYCGLIMISIIPIYLICTNINLKTKIKKTALLLLLFLAFDNELLNFIFHGFHFQTLVPNRFAAFFVFILITILGDVLTTNTKLTIKNILVISCSLIQILLYCLLENKDIAFYTSIIYLGIYIIICITSLIKKQDLIKIILFITIIELLSNQVIYFIHNRASLEAITSTKKINIIATEISDTQKFYNLTEFIEDGFGSSNIGDESNINSLSYFSNTYTKKMSDYSKYMNIKRGPNALMYSSGNPLADMFLKIKYHIVSKYDENSYSIYNDIYHYNDMILYKNPYYLSLGFVIPDEKGNYSKILDKKINKKEFDTAFDYQNYIAKSVIGKNIYNKIECGKKNTDKIYYTTGETYNNNMGNSTTKDYTQVYIHFNESTENYIYTSDNGIIYCLGNVTPYNNELQIDYPTEYVNSNNFEIIIAEFLTDNFNELYEKLNENIMTDLKENGRTITGKIDSKIDGTLYISFPEYDGWQIYIDGKKVEKQQYLGGIGVQISKGKHDITMKYRPEGMIPGILITLLTVILIILDATKTLKKNKS